METEKNFLSLLEKLDRECGERIALRYSPDEPDAFITYHGLYEKVIEKMHELKGVKTVEVRDGLRLSWIITCLASACGGHMTVLCAPGQPAIFSDETYDKNYLPGKLLFFTSGTTSRNKAVVLSQEALLSSAANGQAMLACHSDDRLLSCLPLFHVFGFICSFLWPLTNGAEIDLGIGYHGFLTDTKAYRPTVLSVVPTLLELMLRADVLNDELRMILVGAGPCSQELIDEMLKKGIHLRFGYGLTETASGVAISTDDNDPFTLHPCPDTKAKLSESGELLIRTTCLMDGYYLDSEQTSRKLTDGFLHTGDLAEIDQNGCIHIKGRTDDVLVLPNGEKIFCPEIESEISSLIGAKCVLLMRGSIPTLVVHAPFERDFEIKAKIDEYNQSKPLGRKVPAVELRSEDFPRTVTGKIQRYKL